MQDTNKEIPTTKQTLSVKDHTDQDLSSKRPKKFVSTADASSLSSSSDRNHQPKNDDESQEIKTDGDSSLLVAHECVAAAAATVSQSPGLSDDFQSSNGNSIKESVMNSPCRKRKISSTFVDNEDVDVDSGNNNIDHQTTKPAVTDCVSTPSSFSSNNELFSPIHGASIVTPKRQDYLSWDDYFMAVAILSSKRSKDPDSPSGACIVDGQNRIVGIGYSGFPRGCSDCIFPWKYCGNNNGSDTDNWLHSKHPYLCQAATNAILNKCSNNVEGCRIYVMKFPNSDCAKVIIQSRVDEVVILQRNDINDYDNDDDDDVDTQASRILLTMAGVKIRHYKPTLSFVALDFISVLSPTTANTTSVLPQSVSNPSETPTTERQDDETASRLLLLEANYDSSTVLDNGTREDFISWEDYFMAMAFLTAQRSKDPNTQVGACIVDGENRIIGLGYNGMPYCISDDDLPWARCNENKLHNKYLYVCHAEVNAILNKGSSNVKGATIYVAMFPCENCAKMIIQSGIRQVVFMSDPYHDTPGCRASRIMLQCANVELRHYIPTMQEMVLNFST